jgi:hypothetical protein
LANGGAAWIVGTMEVVNVERGDRPTQVSPGRESVGAWAWGGVAGALAIGVVAIGLLTRRSPTLDELAGRCRPHPVASQLALGLGAASFGALAIGAAASGYLAVGR